MEEALVQRIVSEVIRENRAAPPEHDARVSVEVSGRHVHLCERDVERLFGTGYQLKVKREITQPGQYVCEERVSLIGPKGSFRNVAIIGPPRRHTQVEISLSDARVLGIDPPVAMSGDLSGAADIVIVSAHGCLDAKQCVIAAKNHLHLSGEEADRIGVKDGDLVDILLDTKRPLTLNRVPVRAGDAHRMALHIDYDERNASLFQKDDAAYIRGVCCTKDVQRPGIVPLREVFAPEKKAAEPDVQGAAISESRLLTGVHYLSESAIRKLHEDGCTHIGLEKGTIVSPLARDYASRFHMQLTFDANVKKTRLLKTANRRSRSI